MGFVVPAVIGMAAVVPAVEVVALDIDVAFAPGVGVALVVEPGPVCSSGGVVSLAAITVQWNKVGRCAADDG